MKNPQYVAAFDALVDRGVVPCDIDAAAIQRELGQCNSCQDIPEEPVLDRNAEDALEAWRKMRLQELFYHIEFTVEHLRDLVASGEFDDDDPHTRETIKRLDLSVKSIHHMSIPKSVVALKELCEEQSDEGLS